MSISTVLYFGTRHAELPSWDLTVANEKIATRRVESFEQFERELSAQRPWLVVIDVPPPAGDVRRAVEAVKAEAETDRLPLLLLLASESHLPGVMPAIDGELADYLVGNVSRAAYHARLKLFWQVKQFRERNRALQSAVVGNTEFQLLADNAPVMIWMSGVDKKCYWFNRTWLDFTGRTLEQELGDGWTEGVHRQDVQQCMADYCSAFDRRARLTIAYRLRRSDGEFRWVLDNGAPMFGEDGTFLGYIGSCIDITDVKTAELELKDAVRRKNLFLATLSHELRNPLAPIRNAIKVLEFIRVSPADEAVVSQMKDVMSRQVARMGRLLDDLVDMSHGSREEDQPDDAQSEAAQTATGNQPATQHAGPLPAKRILIVEDNVDTALTLQMILRNWGYKTTIAHTGPEAIELAMQFEPFAVVCDIGLPELDGYQVATVLRRMLGRSLSMIAVSGYGRREDKERALAAGFDDHLVKPANLARLQEFLAASNATAS